ncbi:MAG: alanine--glyoxylate aminotransferase family protein [Bacteroidia bacterium]|nr:alanine--glyoxylate aminotransferase family protein [Bacteroidia bacterium]
MFKLYSPGPVPVPNFVQDALSKAVIHHRSQEFEDFYEGFLKSLSYIFQTEHQVCACMGSGTYGVEMAIYSMFQPGERLVVSANGKFSKRWADYARYLGMEVQELANEWGEAPALKEVMDSLEENPHLQGLILTHSETSTGSLLDLEEIAFEVKRKYPHILILVDGITSIGSLPYFHDDWGIDCSVIASQKALMNPAGLVAFAFSPQGKEKLRETHPSDFQNLYNHLKAAQKNSSAFTPPVQLLFGVDAAMKHMEEESLPAIWNRVQQTARYFRKEIEEMGGKIFPSRPTDSLTAFSFEGKDSTAIKEFLEKEYKLILSGGQGELKGIILRVSHMGLFTQKDMEEVIKALKNALEQS